MKNIYLITGATGFIGSAITRFLVNQHEEVHILVRSNQLNFRLNAIKDALNIHQCDLSSDNVKKVVSLIKPTYVYHLASYGAVPQETDMNKMIEVNLSGTKRLVESLSNQNLNCFIYAGSSSEYGDKEFPMKECDLPNPVNDYGITKVATTLYLQKEAKRNRFPAIIFRLFSPYGYFEQPTRFIPSVIINALHNQPIKLASFKYVRDFIFIEDVINAFLSVTPVNLIHGEIYNIGSGKQHSLGNVTEKIIKIIKSSSQIIQNATIKQNRQTEPLIWQADISKVSKQFGWKPKFSLNDGLIKNIQWFKQNLSFYT
jgi:nucleoside-diphosphate-sugar epimerase